MDRGAWRATVHGATKSQTRLKRLSTQHTKRLKSNSKEAASMLVYPEKHNLPAHQTFRCSSLEASWLGQREIRARPGSQMALIIGSIKCDKWKLTGLAVG